MFDIITFGSATWDIFLKPKDFIKVRNKKFITGKGICFNLGSKVDVKEIHFYSGGGGTNTAATFSRQGFKTAYCGMVGMDLAGESILNELKTNGIDTSLVFETKKAPTNHSVIISGIKEDRTIFVYKGASEYLLNIPFDKLKAKWLYLAPLSGNLCKVFGDLVDFAFRNKMKIAVNLGNCQLSLPESSLKKTLQKVDVLILNQEEASTLTKIHFTKEKELFLKIDDLCSGIAIMTKGAKGVVVSDGMHLYKAKALPVKIVERTGAGDSFSAGFLSEYIRTENIEKAIQLGIANGTSCLTKWGAKNGLLSLNDNFQKVNVKKEHCLKNNLCLCKKCK